MLVPIFFRLKCRLATLRSGWGPVIAAALLVALHTGCAERTRPTRVAVAANFLATASTIARSFERDTGKAVILSPGSTGKLFAQIQAGAPYDLFLSADSLHPTQLEAAKVAVRGTRFTYAIGRLVLCSKIGTAGSAPDRLLRQNQFTRLAIPNPKLAPYGRAAFETMEHMQLAPIAFARLVRGDSVGQTFYFLHSEAADLAFLARSQQPAHWSCWPVPADHHQPIVQQVVLLRESPAARQFLQYLRSVPAREILIRHGYEAPQEQPTLERR